MAEFEFGLEEVGLQPGHCFGVELVFAQGYAPRLRARLAVEQQLIEDATTRGWQREVERHAATRSRIEGLLDDLTQPPTE